MPSDILSPLSIALIGASHTPGKLGYGMLYNLKKLGYRGEIYPVNPNIDGEIMGLEVYPDVKSLPEVPDLTLIAIPAELVNKEVEACGKKKIKNIVIISAGFKEVGGAGVKREAELAKLVKKYDLNLIGPNCLGIINTEIKMNASFAEGMPKKGNVSLISQSGAMAVAIIDWAYNSGVGFSKILSMGNKAGMGENALLEYLGEDEKTDVILMYLESIDDGKEFMEIAKKVSLKKPIIAIKSGTSEAGEKAISSHTGALAGSDKAVESAFEKCGIIRADTIEDLFDYAKAFCNQALPQGNRVAVVTNAGGPGIMAADAVASSCLDLAEISKKTQSQLKKKLPKEASLNNPIDVIGDATPERYEHALDCLLKDKEIDAVVALLTPQIMTEPKKVAKAIVDRSKKYPKKTVLASFMGGKNIYQAEQIFRKFHFPDFDYSARAVRSLERMWEYGEWKANHESRITNHDNKAKDPKKAKAILGKKRKVGTKLKEEEVNTVLEAYGINSPKTLLAKSEKDVLKFANEIGYPVVLKISSSNIFHKTEAGGVCIDIDDAAEAKSAYKDMLKKVKKAAPKAKIDGVLVQPMYSMGKEIIVGAKYDEQFGHLMMFGLGGIYVEILQDVSFGVAPLSKDEAMKMIQSTRAFELLQGARGEKAVNLDSLVDIILRISQIVTDYPNIQEFEINPLIVDGKNGGVAVDTRCIV